MYEVPDKGHRTVVKLASLVFGGKGEMVKLETVRSSNAQGKQLKGLVAVFVGGTGGIGECTAKEFFHRTTAPKAYIIGRSQERGDKIVKELHEINPEGKAIFLQRDISFIRVVDATCREISKCEQKINCLFLTAGYMTLSGRNETDEGMDRKMMVNYYSRIRWTLNMMPLLTAASKSIEISRVMTVLAAGSEGDVQLDDLDLRHNFSLHACLAHCAVMSDFMVEELARRFPGTSFSHSYPGTVKTGIANELTGPVRLAVKVFYAVMTPWILNVQGSGERHFFQMSSQCYPAADGAVGIPIPEGLSTNKGSNGKTGSGAYLLDWDGKSTGDERILRQYREMGMSSKVWDHTMAIFQQAERINARRPPNRPATDEAEGGGGRPALNPIGWRPG